MTSCLVLALAGCSSILPLQPPDLTLANMTVSEVTPLETSAAVTVRIANENNEPLYITGGVFNVSLNGVRIGKALSNQPIEVPALGEATQDVILRINNIALATRLRPILTSGSVNYRLKAKVYAKGAVGTRTLKVNKDGSMDLPESWTESINDVMEEGLNQ